jgi:hypothetical protein
MIPVEDFKNLDYNGLVDLLGKLTKQYTSELANDPTRIIDDEKIYSLNLLIKEIEIREQMILDNDGNLTLSL